MEQLRVKNSLESERIYRRRIYKTTQKMQVIRDNKGKNQI